MKLLTIFILGLAFSYWVLAMDCKSIGTLKQRHDAIKLVIGDLDDQIVRFSLIDDKTLHSIGNTLGISEKRN